MQCTFYEFSSQDFPCVKVTKGRMIQGNMLKQSRGRLFLHRSLVGKNDVHIWMIHHQFN
jgi:hypothetical protein